MNAEQHATYQEIKEFLAFDDADAERLQALAPVFAKHGPRIIDMFYASLLSFEKTAALIQGHVDELKKLHTVWMVVLFQGEYGRPFFDRQHEIGHSQVNQQVDPEYVEAFASMFRTYGRIAIVEEMGNNDNSDAHFDSMCKIIDLALITVNLSFAEERLDRLSWVTRMSREHIEALIKRGGPTQLHV